MKQRFLFLTLVSVFLIVFGLVFFLEPWARPGVKGALTEGYLTIVQPLAGMGLTLNQPTESESWRDEFASKHSRWNWSYNRGTGYKRLVELPGAPSALEIGITRESNQDAYSDCSLHEKSANYQTGVLEMRLRLIDEVGPGTRGWGFWDANLDILDVAWFWSASPESDPELAGFRVMVIRSGVFLLNQEIPAGTVDLRAWHVYRVELHPDGARFFIDGDEIASTTGRPANPQRAELWIDNMAVQLGPEGYTTYNLDLDQDQRLVIDWVAYNSNLPEDPPGDPPESPPGDPPDSLNYLFLPVLRQ